MKLDDQVLRRFWAKVEVTPHCWEWVAARTTAGYGSFGIDKRAHYAHRLSYAIHFGDIPDGLHVRHKCDNRACVNPDHLELGTNADNVRDKVERGRHLRGAACGMSKLTEQQVLEIRSAPRSYRVRVELAQKFGVTVGHVSALRGGQYWSECR